MRGEGVAGYYHRGQKYIIYYIIIVIASLTRNGRKIKEYKSKARIVI